MTAGADLELAMCRLRGLVEVSGFGPYDDMVLAVVGLVAEEWDVTLAVAAGLVLPAAEAHLAGAVAEGRLGERLMRFAEDLGGRVAADLGDGPGDQAAAEEVYRLVDLAAWPALPTSGVS